MPITAHYVTHDFMSEILENGHLLPNHSYKEVDILPWGDESTFESFVEDVWDWFICEFQYTEEVAELITNEIILQLPDDYSCEQELHIKAFKIPSHLYFTLYY